MRQGLAKRQLASDAKPVVPMIDKGAFGYQHVNAAQQRSD
jgi:hypothetical protein